MSNDIVRLGEMTETTAITIRTSEQDIALSVRDIMRWVAPNAPPDECLKFLMVCKARGLNPLLGEAHLVPFGPKYGTVIGKAGYIKLMEQNPQYAGHEAGIIVIQWDPVAKKDVGNIQYLDGSFLPANHRLLGGWARVYRHDRKTPTYITVGMSEYGKSTATWQSLPATMIRKVAIVHAAEESGLVSGPRGYTPEEAPVPIYAEEGIHGFSEEALTVEYAKARDDAPLPPDYVAKVMEITDKLGIDRDSFEFRDALAKRGASAVADLTVIQASDMITRLSGLLPHDDLVDDDVETTEDGEVIDVAVEPEVVAAPA